MLGLSGLLCLDLASKRLPLIKETFQFLDKVLSKSLKSLKCPGSRLKPHYEHWINSEFSEGITTL